MGPGHVTREVFEDPTPSIIVSGESQFPHRALPVYLYEVPWASDVSPGRDSFPERPRTQLQQLSCPTLHPSVRGTGKLSVLPTPRRVGTKVFLTSGSSPRLGTGGRRGAQVYEDTVRLGSTVPVSRRLFLFWNQSISVPEPIAHTARVGKTVGEGRVETHPIVNKTTGGNRVVGRLQGSAAGVQESGDRRNGSLECKEYVEEGTRYPDLESLRGTITPHFVGVSVPDSESLTKSYLPASTGTLERTPHSVLISSLVQQTYLLVLTYYLFH